MMDKNITKSIKVAQLSGYVSAETGYHHGEMSLQQAIIGMGQNFVGSNNISLLYGDGNFGSRLNGGKDAASPRYIFTRLSDVTQSIFKSDDFTLLNYLDDDGISIEPEWYLPVIPMVLVNGCEGIGTGYSTYIPPFNPKDIIANLLRVLDDKDPIQMIPYFRGFNGIVEKVESAEGSYLTRGKWERLSDFQIKITELPVGTWVTTYKEFLESLVIDNNSNKKKDKEKDASKKKTNKILLKDVKNKTRDENDDICFIVDFKSSEDLDNLIKGGILEKELKLIKTFSTNNMYLFGEDLILTKYKEPIDILLDFYDIRLEFYEKRKIYLTKKLESELALLKSKVRFIEEYINGKLDINRKTRDYINDLLEKSSYPKFGYENSEEKSYDYLVRMQIVSLTQEKIVDLNKQKDEKQRQLDYINSKTEKDLWKNDLEIILKTL
jgi:DNA topoisomerase-2